jgi:hypothetical protein
MTVQQSNDPFVQVRRERDPITQARLAGQLIVMYQQRSTELARLRKEAINRAVQEKGMTYSAVATELGLTRGRITQIRQSAPPAERAFFGVGPVTVAVPLREVPGRKLPVISSEDTTAYETLAQLLTSLSFAVERYNIPAHGQWKPPAGDVVAICGPKSSPVTAAAIESDPFLTFSTEPDGTWTIRERSTDTIYRSPMDDPDQERWSDIAYLGRLPIEDRTMIVIAGVHALGSVGAVDYLVKNLSNLYAEVGANRFSVVVRSDHEGAKVTHSEALCPPRLHPTSP